MELPRRRMYGCEEEDAMTLFRAGAGRSISMSIAAGEHADDDVLNLYGNGTAAVSSATERHHLCHEPQQARSSRHSRHVDEDDEIEQTVVLRQRRQKQQQQVVADADATDAVLVARDNQAVARQNAAAAERNAEAAREQVAMALASAPRVAGGDDVAAEVAAGPRRRRQRHDAAAQRDNDAATAAAEAAAARAHHAEIAHLLAEGVAELGRLRAEVVRRSDEAAAGIVMSFAAALFAPLLMAALLYYILP